jgi:hypothetical protein
MPVVNDVAVARMLVVKDGVVARMLVVNML